MWKQAQEEEKGFWGDCSNTYNEETKQYIYAEYMGIPIVGNYGIRTFDLHGLSVLDVGGGPVSMLLKTDASKKTVVDPCNYPHWVGQRYAECGISYVQAKGESFVPFARYDIGLIYNVLQHVEDPEQVIKNMRSCCNEIAIFEWVNAYTNTAHPHILDKNRLDAWLDTFATVNVINRNPCVGQAYFGRFNYA